jgi:hypothetical protein
MLDVTNPEEDGIWVSYLMININIGHKVTM